MRAGLGNLGLGIAAALLMPGCMSWPQAWQVKPFSQAIADDIPPFGEVEVTLKDGRVERVKNVGDHGYALCGEWACFRKTDIATVGYRPERVDPVRSAVAVPLVAPALVVLGAICTINCEFNGPTQKATGKEPVATPQQIERRWLDGLRIENGKLMAANGLGPNPCVGDKPTAVGRTFATDGEAFDWIVANRHHVSKECLDRVVLGGRAGPGPDQAARTETGQLLVSATYAVRWKWNLDRCVMTTQNDYLGRQARERVTPLPRYVSSDRRGNPEALRLIEEALADPASYVYEGDLPRECTQGILPRDQWPDLPAWIEAHSPFAPKPAGTLP